MQRNPLAYHFNRKTSDADEMRQFASNFPGFFNRDGQHVISSVKELDGGLTNKNYLVRTHSSEYVAREPGVGSEKYIHRANEALDTAKAFAAGVTPEVVYDDKKGMKVTRYLPQPMEMSEARLRNPQYLLQVVQILKQLHGGEPFAATIDVFARNREWLALTEKKGYLVPLAIHNVQDSINQIEDVLKRFHIARVPCHNDTTPGNFVLSQGKMQLIDFEYAGNNDPVFDLAYLAAEGCFTQHQSEFMLRAYFADQLTEEIKQRFRLYQPVVHYTNAVWAHLQLVMKNVDDEKQIYALMKRNLSHCQELLEMESIKTLMSEPAEVLQASAEEEEFASSGCCAKMRKRR